jgi:NAD(P)-dependent dehydrogenase (short-subunit alcohol dehydrogenase family)
MTAAPVALVTGASRGIGKETCRQLHQRGFHVIVTGRSLDKVMSAALDVSGDERLTACQLDITDDASVGAAVDTVTERIGRLDVLINNAAIHYDSWQSTHAADLSIVDDAWRTNVLGAWRATIALLPLLRQSPHPRIVNVSSEAGAISEMSGGTPAYSVSKAALNALTRLLAGELRRDRILVNAICPGWTDTDMGQGGRPVEDGAASVVWGALLDDDGPTGGFFRDGRLLPW